MSQKALAIRRRVDPMRRVTLPSELADKYRIQIGDHVEICDMGDCIAIRPAVKRCIVCGSQKDLVLVREEHICLDCVELAGKVVGEKAERLRAVVTHIHSLS